jgi:carbamoyl-phosphate synthase large subunit
VDARAPALIAADEKILIPPMYDPEYCDVLFDICQKQQARLIVPVNDLEIPALARHAARFRSIGTIPLVPSPEIVAICRDKWKTFHWAKENGIDVPPTFLTLADAQRAVADGRLSFPLIIKPRWGTSSICTDKVEDERELQLAYEWNKIQLGKTILIRMTESDLDYAFVFQQFVTGDEFGMDVVSDLNGRHVTTLARKKLTTRAGNTDRAISVRAPALERLGQSLGEKLSHPASIDCDVIVNAGGCHLLDVNPRLGGGYPFSHAAGANLPAALVAWATGTEPDPAWLRAQSGVVAAKYDEITAVDPIVDEATGACGGPVDGPTDIVSG